MLHPVAINVFSDPVFSVRDAGRTLCKFDLPQLLHGLQTGEAVALQRMQAHQRAGLLLTLAFLSAILKHHAGRGLESPGDWREELVKTFGIEGGRLTAPFDEPAFLQPRLLGEAAETDPQHSIADIDILFANAGHVLKCDSSEAGPEDALLALMSGITRRYVLKGIGGSRASTLFAVPCVPGDFSSEVRALSAAWLSVMGGARRVEHVLNGVAQSAKDHLFGLEWRLSGGAAEAPVMSGNRLAYPALDLYRPIRLVAGETGILVQRFESRISCAIDKQILSKKAGLGDPQVGYDSRGRFQPMAPNWSSLIRMTAGHEFIKPFILDPEFRKGATHLRVFGVPTDNGKTLGIFDRLIPLPEAAPSDEDFDLAEAAKDALEAGDVAQAALMKAMKPVLEALCGSAKEADRAKAMQGDLRELYSDALGVPLAAAVLAKGVTRELRRVTRRAGAQALAVFCERTGTGVLGVSAAVERAKLIYALELKRSWKEEELDMSGFEDDPKWAAGIARAFQDGIVRAPRREEMARIRDGGAPLAFHQLLADLGLADFADDADAFSAMARMARIVAKGNSATGAMSFGAALWPAGVSEARIQMLLSASGEPLIAAIESAAAMIWSGDATRHAAIDWSPAIALALADARADDAAKSAAARRIARDWAVKSVK